MKKRTVKTKPKSKAQPKAKTSQKTKAPAKKPGSSTTKAAPKKDQKQKAVVKVASRVPLRPSDSYLSMRAIENDSELQSHGKVRDVRLSRIELGRRKNGNLVVRARATTDGPSYTVWVECTSRDKEGNPEKLSKGKVKCSCSCPYFVFWGCEVPLNYDGAANIKFSNGQPPVIRNPGMESRFCKHGLALFKVIRQNRW